MLYVIAGMCHIVAHPGFCFYHLRITIREFYRINSIFICIIGIYMLIFAMYIYIYAFYYEN